MRELLPILPKPSRYIGTEEGSVRKNVAETTLHVGLAFPDLYEVGMSYLGQKILYGIVNARANWFAERVFSPCREAGDILKQHQAALCTLESDTPLCALHFLGFHLTHELCYTNVLNMLELGNIPLRSQERGDSLFDYPIIAAGGGCTLSAEPMAPFFDLMMLGEGEELLPEVLEILEQARKDNLSRTEFLRKASSVPGVYVPGFFTMENHGLKPLVPGYDCVRRRVIDDMDKALYPESQVIPFGAVHNRLTLEIARGCTRGCRFCQAGMVYRPARERSVAELSRLVNDCLAHTGYDDLSFLSLSTGDFSALKTLFLQTADCCAKEQISLSLPSLRVGSIDDSIMARMAGIRRTGATLAPEAGTQRLRDVINKGITEEALILHVQKLIEHGWQRVKLYFMIGLPTETDEDLHGIVDLCRKVRDAAGRGRRRLLVTAAISPFVPKPHTPFQWEAQASLEEISRRISLLRELFKQEKSMQMRWHEPAMSRLEGILSRGDRRLADVVESAFRKGALFDSWIENFSFSPWQEAMDEHGLSIEEYTGPRSLEAPLPWAHLHSGVSREFLIRERERGLMEKISGDCRYEVCRQCGVCDTKAHESGLARSAALLRYSNKLNFSTRDQEAHAPKLDEWGKVIIPEVTSRPAGVPEELTVRAAQYRIWYAKEAESVFLSQLELQSIFERAMRRAGLQLSFSRGFHPLPLLTFGRALPVGVASRAEWFAVVLREAKQPTDIVRSMQDGMPRGIKLLYCEELPYKKNLPQAVRETFLLECLSVAKTHSFKEAWQNFAGLDKFSWTRNTKKGERTLDARALTSSITFQGDAIVELAFDWSVTYVSPLALCCAVCPETLITDLRLTKLQQEFESSTRK